MTQVTIYISNIHSQRFVSGDSGEGLDNIGCPEDEDEEAKLLKQAIELSVEEDTEDVEAGHCPLPGRGRGEWQ